MNGAAGTKRCTIVYALRERQWMWTVELPLDASVGEALEAARRACAEAPEPDVAARVPWDGSAIGIFGEIVEREYVPEDGDRIEIYRPLQHDPKVTRRERARRLRTRGR
jgi:putative ubiquitin-RnfH superfamily antitoxin RatB of RatAB toxin-antitoxin module